MTTAEGIIGRVFSGTRMQDTSYVADMQDWIVEVLDQARVKNLLVPRWKDVRIRFHKGKLPRKVAYIDAVSHKGRCVPFGTGRQVDPRLPTGLPLFSSIDLITVGNVTGADLIPPIYDWASGEYYHTEADCIVHSVANTHVRVWYHTMPVDCDGYPHVPDDEALKQACYWYIRMKIIETGYKDPVFKWGDCLRQFDKFLPMAIEHFLTDTVQDMDRKVNNLYGGWDNPVPDSAFAIPSHQQPPMWLPINKPALLPSSGTPSTPTSITGMTYEDLVNYSNIDMTNTTPRMIYVESDENNNFDTSLYIHTGTELKFLQTVT